MNSADRIVHLKLGDEIFIRLKKLIANGYLKPGDKMPSERELTRPYSVGRGVVRDAMQALARKGFISISQGARATVAAPTVATFSTQVQATTTALIAQSPDYKKHFLEAHLFLEKSLARQAALNSTTEQTRKLYRILDEQRSVLNDTIRLRTTDAEFHHAIAGISSNPVLVAAYQTMKQLTNPFKRSVDPRIELADHEKIVDAISRQDPTNAEASTERHLLRTYLLPARISE